ncbi:leucine-rich repeat-containing G-protein coupled receptor 4-like [Culicoides brevitarsis]|uniref:leucine-rich repeat-containing G-protein coupled receptor 4-like n=1 Tax=Culicoides brevitarsis TaxID=469753 RepID=UPI00307B7E9A
MTGLEIFLLGLLFYGLTRNNPNNNSISPVHKCCNTASACTFSDEIAEDAFHSCQILRKLDLSQNQIQKLHSNTFKGLTNLEYLDVDHNQLKELNGVNYLFKDLHNLNTLDLSGNKIIEFPAENLKNNRKLMKIYLNSNGLSDLEVEKLVEILPDLKELNSRKRKKTLARTNNCANLKELCLDFSHIKKLHSNTFKGLTNLEELSLSYNKLTELDDNLFEDLHNLKKLDLSGNDITIFHPEILKNNKNLKEIWLHLNDLTNLDFEKIVKFCPKLNGLHWDGNQVSCSRVKEANNFLKSKNIDFYSFKSYKNRSYTTDTIDGFQCVPDETWNTLFSKSDEIKEIDEKVQESLSCVKHFLGSCIFSGINLTLSDYEWQPTADDPDSVLKIDFKSSVVPIMYDNICKAFPKLEYLNINSLKIQKVAENAFHNCTNLKELKLSLNHIKKLHPNTFKGLTNLENLWLQNNELTELDDNLFEDLHSLEKLSLSGNDITSFDPEILRNNKNLESLWLCANDLPDLDVEKIVELCPKLTILALNENQVSCSRAKVTNTFLKSKNIEFYSWNIKYRNYTTDTIDGFQCVPDETWNTLFLKSNEIKEIQEKVQEVDFLSGIQKKLETLGDEQEKFRHKMESMEKEIKSLTENMEAVIFLLYSVKDEMKKMNEKLDNFSDIRKEEIPQNAIYEYFKKQNKLRFLKQKQ